MRKQTERKYRNCPEVKNKKVEIKRKEEYKTNKIMANIFNKVLEIITFHENMIVKVILNCIECLLKRK